MKHFCRWAYSGFVVVSLAVFVAASGLWIRTIWNPDEMYWSDGSNYRMVWVYWVSGRLVIEIPWGNRSYGIRPGFHFDRNYYPDIPIWAGISSPARKPIGWYHEIVGIGVGHQVQTFSQRGLFFSDTTVVIPLWLFQTLAAVLPAAAVIRYMRNLKRVRRGLCATCGYDLRATPDRCPECGREAPATHVREVH
jgi:hypothetical protein